MYRKEGFRYRRHDTVSYGDIPPIAFSAIVN
jgi:hypothetical protein